MAGAWESLPDKAKPRRYSDESDEDIPKPKPAAAGAWGASASASFPAKPAAVAAPPPPVAQSQRAMVVDTATTTTTVVSSAASAERIWPAPQPKSASAGGAWPTSSDAKGSWPALGPKSQAEEPAADMAAGPARGSLWPGATAAQPGMTSSGVPTSQSWAAVDARQKQLASGHEQQLSARETALIAREQEIDRARASNLPKNWPSCCPFMVHNIAAQVPSWNQGMVKGAYINIWFFALAELLNWGICCALLAKKQVAVWDWFVCTIGAWIGVPLTFFLAYRSLYWAAQTDGSSVRYTMAIIYYLVYSLWCLWVFLSVPVAGSFNAGIWTAIKLYQDGYNGTSIFSACVANSILFGCMTVWAVWILYSAIMAYKKGDQPRRHLLFGANPSAPV